MPSKRLALLAWVLCLSPTAPTELHSQDSLSTSPSLRSTSQTAYLNHPFTITIFKVGAKADFLVSKIDPNHTTLLNKKNSKDKVVFSFMPIRVGETEVFIDEKGVGSDGKPHQKPYVQYKVTILPVEGNAAEEKKVSSPKLGLKPGSSSATQNSKAQKDLNLIRQYLRDGASNLLGEAYKQFMEEHGRTNVLAIEVLQSMDKFWFGNKQHNLAKEELLKALRTSSIKISRNNEAWLHYRLGRHLLAEKNYDDAFVHFHAVKNEHKGSPFYSASLFFIGEVAHMSKKHESAVRAYNAFLDAHKSVQQKHSVPNYDLALWRLGRLHETVRSVLDLRESARLYALLVKTCPFSERLKQAQGRLAYLQKNFLDITQ